MWIANARRWQGYFPPGPFPRLERGRGRLASFIILGPSRPLLWRACSINPVDRTFSVIIKAWLSVPCAFPLPIEGFEQVQPRATASGLPGGLGGSLIPA